MRLRPDQLARHLRGPLAPVYLVSGDEPLQREETLDAIRAAARAAGHQERIVLHADSTFDWGELRQHQQSMSLFADRQLIDLRLVDRPGTPGGQALLDYAERPNPDAILLVSGSRMDREAMRARWYKALEEAGASVQVWPVAAGQLQGWIRARASGLGMQLGAEAAAALAERVEGNLLACAQELEKLRLLVGEGEPSLDEVLASCGESARYSPYDLVDAALAGDVGRALRILRGLREEGVAPPLLVWTLAREVRTVTAVCEGVEGGLRPDAAMAAAKVWERRKALVTAAARRHRAHGARELLALAAAADGAVKGATRDRPWDVLEALVLALAGLKIFTPTTYNQPLDA
ncbi:MAG: DNA polymerase III subunit delta [Ectothiorhodospiraceae bacterium]|nr:DNA polymerase III subunit delta [Chromatiales bacterium]MCP5156321.1 DNA polymerase III subunit delta [Ectothiorhodospiraceae bacterium]